jgi:hypothetical protein
LEIAGELKMEWSATVPIKREPHNQKHRWLVLNIKYAVLLAMISLNLNSSLTAMADGLGQLAPLPTPTSGDTYFESPQSAQTASILAKEPTSGSDSYASESISIRSTPANDVSLELRPGAMKRIGQTGSDNVPDGQDHAQPVRKLPVNTVNGCGPAIRVFIGW